MHGDEKLSHLFSDASLFIQTFSSWDASSMVDIILVFLQVIYESDSKQIILPYVGIHLKLKFTTAMLNYN